MILRVFFIIFNVSFPGLPHHPEHRHVAWATGTWAHPEVLRPALTQVGRTVQRQRGSPQESRVNPKQKETSK
jgi:hypothetical protein